MNQAVNWVYVLYEQESISEMKSTICGRRALRRMPMLSCTRLGIAVAAMLIRHYISAAEDGEAGTALSLAK